MMAESEIVDEVLLHLQGYVAESDEELSDLEYDKKVSSEEVLQFYRICQAYALSYLNLQEFPTQTIIEDDTEIEVINPTVETAVRMWTAGKVWQKYNVRVNNNEDDTNPFGFGDKLVIQAKEMLKPFKYYKMMVY